MNPEELHHLATQLSHPEGDFGIELAHNMNETNIGMTRQAIANLGLEPGDSVLELGHGNGGHIAELLSEAASVSYSGLEISGTMHEEAKRLNGGQPARFFTYDGENIPFEDGHFDKALTVNTLYFWRDPAKMLEEIRRVLKPGSVLCLTFAEKDSMMQLAFTDYVFTLYSPQEVAEVVGRTGFEIAKTERAFEDVMSKTGHHIRRYFVTMVLRK